MKSDNAIDRIRWLHLSDFHTGRDDYGQRKLFLAIIKHIKEKRSEGFSPDFIFITGDISNRGVRDEYVQFEKEFLAPLYEVLPAEAIKRIFIVPGNHDAFIETHQYFTREAILSKSSHFFDPTEEGNNQRKQILPRFEGYSASPKITPANWLSSTSGSFSTVIQIRGVSVGIVGTNSAWLTKAENDRDYLTPGVFIIEEALENIGKAQLKIVLGHHPINWFDDEHEDQIRAIFGQNNAVYLHGHLHRSRVSPEDGAGYGFLCIQSGAAFVTRSDDKWVNGLLWAEADLGCRELRIQPREWSPNNRDWRLGGDLPDKRRLSGKDWWSFPIPGDSYRRTPNDSECISSSIRYPKGWQIVDESFIERVRTLQSDTFLIHFFDGANPDWRIAISPIIKSLNVVKIVKSKIENYKTGDRPQIVLMIGPVGEGKSTALLQVVASLIESNCQFNILWHADEFTQISTHELLQLPKTDTPWLIVSDSADLISKDIHDACMTLKKECRNDIRFLLTCRDTDWLSTNAHKWDWISFSVFSKIAVEGLTHEDAQLIAESWHYFKSSRTDRLKSLSLHETAEELYVAARKNASLKRGSLLGAVLKVRFGEDLTEHIKALMKRLSNRDIPGGGDLLMAFGYISAMHAIGQQYLSRPVLSEVLCCPLEKLNTHVLIPLGMETAVSTDGVFILARHQSIAEVTLKLLEGVFGQDIDQLYKDLIKAAMVAKVNNFIPNYNNWIFNYAQNLMSKGRHDIAVYVAREVIARNPNNTTIAISVAKTLAVAGLFNESYYILSNLSVPMYNKRGFYTELGTLENKRGNPIIAILYLFYSISDQADRLQIGLRYAKPVLFQISICFIDIYKEFLLIESKNGAEASKRLLLSLRTDEELKKQLEDIQNELSEDASECSSIFDANDLDKYLAELLESFEAICKNFSGIFDKNTIEKIGSISSWTFDGIKKLLKNAITSKIT